MQFKKQSYTLESNQKVFFRVRSYQFLIKISKVTTTKWFLI